MTEILILYFFNNGKPVGVYYPLKWEIYYKLVDNDLIKFEESNLFWNRYISYKKFKEFMKALKKIS